MNDDNQLFGNFEPTSPPSTAPAKRTRKKRGARSRAAPAATEAVPPAAPAPRQRKKRQPRAARYTLAEALEITAGLTPEDIALVNQIGALLSAQGKAARARVVAALARIFT